MNSEQPVVVAISGSTRRDSYTTLALNHTLDAAELAGATTKLITLEDHDIPLFQPNEEIPPDVANIQAVIDSADAVLLGTPMYHGSYSSTLKTVLDYCSDEEFGGKTLGLLAVAGGAFPLAALDHLRVIARSLGSWVLPHQVAIPQADSAFDADGVPGPELHDRLIELGRNLVEYSVIEPTRILRTEMR